VLLKSPKKTLVCELLSRAAFAGSCKNLTQAQAQRISGPGSGMINFARIFQSNHYFMKKPENHQLLAGKVYFGSYPLNLPINL
jgi:hypothetical protein